MELMLYINTLESIEYELDRKYYGIVFTDKFEDLNESEFISIQLNEINNKINFLIFIGEGKMIAGIPSVIKTRLKNKIHRSIYLEMRYKNGKGVITDCHYSDRKYKQRISVIPETLTTVFFDYNRQAILNIINSELNTAFTHIIFVTDGSLNNVFDNKAVLYGNI